MCSQIDASATVHIMPGMIELRSPIGRLLTLALPVSLIWMLVACVFVCASHVEEAAQQDDSSVVVAAPHADDCCQIVAPTGLRPENWSVAVSCGVIDAWLFTPKKAALSSGVQVHTFTPAFSPPFERLCTLRI
jgi:hypothetical protein